MSVGDLYDVERTGEFAVAPTRVRRRRHVTSQAPTGQPVPRNSGSVAIVVLTSDAALADAIHDAAAAAHPVTVASTPDEAFELAANGRCGILITDQVSTQPVLRRTTQRLREAEPALVVIAVGGAGDQNGLCNLLSSGVVDRLMLKPITPALAQTVLKSAAQQHRTLQGAGTAVAVIEQREPAVVLVELQRHAANDLTEAKLDAQPSPAEVVVPASLVAPAKTLHGIDIPRLPWIAVMAALLVVASVFGWMAVRKPAIDAQAVIASNLAAGQRAFREGHALEPRGQSAFDYYNTVLALDPANASARQGIDQVADRFAAQAEVALARGQLAAAIVAIDSVRRVRPDHRQLAGLLTQLDAAQEKLVAAVPERVEAAPQPATKPAPPQATEARAQAATQAAEALKRDQLELANALLGEQQRREKVELAKAGKSFDQATQLLAQTNDFELSAASPQPVAIEPPQPTAAAASAPKLIRVVRPDYPQDALINGAEGWVNVSMSVTPAGDVREPRVVESSNGTMFDRAALSTVRKWKYEPFAATEPQRVIVRVDFRLKGRR